MPNIEPNTLPHFILAGLDDITILILMFASFLSFVVALAEEVEIWLDSRFFYCSVHFGRVYGRWDD